MKKLLLATLCGVLSLSSVALPIKLAGKPDDDKLHLTLLKEIVSRSEKYSTIDFIYAKTGEPAGTRLLADLESGTLDVVWTATNQDLEARFDAIPFPIYRGMLGMRIGLVSKERANKLASVNSVSDLKRLSLCSGKTWPIRRYWKRMDFPSQSRSSIRIFSICWSRAIAAMHLCVVSWSLGLR